MVVRGPMNVHTSSCCTLGDTQHSIGKCETWTRIPSKAKRSRSRTAHRRQHEGWSIQTCNNSSDTNCNISHNTDDDNHSININNIINDSAGKTDRLLAGAGECLQNQVYSSTVCGFLEQFRSRSFISFQNRHTFGRGRQECPPSVTVAVVVGSCEHSTLATRARARGHSIGHPTEWEVRVGCRSDPPSASQQRSQRLWC